MSTSHHTRMVHNTIPPVVTANPTDTGTFDVQDSAQFTEDPTDVGTFITTNRVHASTTDPGTFAVTAV